MSVSRGRFQWFYSNKFYEVTPLVGYSFINLAKTVIEKVFWYSMVVLFTTLTVVNVKAAVQFYMTKPTNTHVKFQSNSSDVSMENFTIELQTSLFELAPHVPIDTEHDSIYGMKDILCINWHKKEVEKLIEKHISEVSKMSENSHCSSDTREDWLNYSMSGISNAIENLFSEHNENMPIISYAPKDEDQKVMFEIFQNHFYNFASKWWTTLSKYHKAYLTKFQQILQPVTCPGTLESLEQLQNASQGIRDLYKTTNNMLSKHFIIDTGVRGSRIFLREWEGSKKSKTHRILYQVTLPRNIQSVTLKIYSSKLAYFLLILESLTNELKYLFFRYNAFNLDIVLTNQLHDRGCSVCKDYLHCTEWNYANLEPLKTSAMMRRIGIVTLDEITKLFEWKRAMYAWFTAMADHYRRTTDLRVNLASGQVKMNVFQKSKVLLFAAGRFRTLTENCMDRTVTQCVDLCVNDLFLKTCNCYPWNLQHLNTETSDSMCDNDCPEVKNNNCLQECNAIAKEPCDRSFHTNEQRQYEMDPVKMSRIRTPSEMTFMEQLLIDDINVVSNLPLSSALIQLKDPLTYPVYTESYSMTWGDLVSQLGGLMDFWLGLNIMCLAHLMVYVVRQFISERGACSWAIWRAVMGKSAKKMLKLQRAELKVLHEKLIEYETKITELSQHANEEEEKLAEFEEQMKKLMENLSIKDIPEKPMRNEENILRQNLGKWWWLRGNKFYAQTPLEGYAFINEASSTMEVMLWYGILVLFTVLTIRDIANAFAVYGQRPVTSSVRMVSDTGTGIIPNFTLTLTRPFYEYIPADKDFHLDWESHTSWQLSDWPLNFPCEMSKSGWIERLDSWSREMSRTGAHSLLSLSPSQMETLVNDTPGWPELYKELKTAISTMSYDSWAEWYKTSMIEFGTKLSDLFEDYRQALVKYSSFTAVHTSAPMAERFEKLFLSLTNVTSILGDQQLVAIMRMTLLENTLRGNATLYLHMFDSLVSDEFLQKQSNWLYSMISRQNLELFTRHSNMDMAALKHELVLQAVVPESSKEITVEIYSKNFTFMLVLLQELARHLGQLLELINKGINDGNLCIPCYIHLFYCNQYESYLDEHQAQILNMDLRNSILPNFYENTYLELRQFYSENMALHLESDSGQYELKPFQQHHLNLIPTGRYLSKTEGCYQGSYGRCVDECQLERYMQNCNCFPWLLQDLVDRRETYKMCKEKCNLPQDEACETDCAAKVEHPCDITQFRASQSSYPIKHFDFKDVTTPEVQPNLPIVSFSISLKETMIHPMFVEEYSMTPSKLFSQLGGRIEFWLGLNVVSLVHMTVYFIRQCKHASNKHTKTGHTLRLIFGMAQENRKVEEEISSDDKSFKTELLEIEKVIQEVNRKQKDGGQRRKIEVQKLEKRLGANLAI